MGMTDKIFVGGRFKTSDFVETLVSFILSELDRYGDDLIRMKSAYQNIYSNSSFSFSFSGLKSPEPIFEDTKFNSSPYHPVSNPAFYSHLVKNTIQLTVDLAYLDCYLSRQILFIPSSLHDDIYNNFSFELPVSGNWKSQNKFPVYPFNYLCGLISYYENDQNMKEYLKNLINDISQIIQNIQPIVKDI